MSGFDIRRDTPSAPDALRLITAHLEQMQAQTPAESIHAVDVTALEAEDISFFSLSDHGEMLAIGAVKRLGGKNGEVKSMHVAQAARGRGAGKTLLNALIDHARDQGMSQLWLETGSSRHFVAARGLYESAGFTYCAPFDDYTDDPLSVFMTRTI